jgi:hypothetical protein
MTIENYDTMPNIIAMDSTYAEVQVATADPEFETGDMDLLGVVVGLTAVAFVVAAVINNRRS